MSLVIHRNLFPHSLPLLTDYKFSSTAWKICPYFTQSFLLFLISCPLASILSKNPLLLFCHQFSLFQDSKQWPHNLYPYCPWHLQSWEPLVLFLITFYPSWPLLALAFTFPTRASRGWYSHHSWLGAEAAGFIVISHKVSRKLPLGVSEAAGCGRVWANWKEKSGWDQNSAWELFILASRCGSSLNLSGTLIWFLVTQAHLSK